MECTRISRMARKGEANARPCAHGFSRKSNCELCVRDYMAKWYAANAEAEKAKALARYYQKRIFGLIGKSTSKVAAWRAAHPQETKAHRIQHEATRRARKAGAAGSHTLSEWRAICARQRNLCTACGDECKLTKDHVVPLSMGGSNDASNLQGLCGPCNSRKGARISVDTNLKTKESVHG